MWLVQKHEWKLDKTRKARNTRHRQVLHSFFKFSQGFTSVYNVHNLLEMIKAVIKIFKQQMDISMGLC